MIKKSIESLVLTNGRNGVEHWATGAHDQVWVNLNIKASRRNIMVKTYKL